ncbi:efflux transporter outer membrane subunit [Altericroceibacterium endophyticum]|uniref:Efflux transporter outer membrane subunit n=1 Tax=Altericroceibacterium endophyticum TaxID=1808508 RepID=A0A6I4T5Z5_9SPHN|nr:efflux transporter outer membrane subunit [Altericroceibacterium endophyticum]MXO66088.1 efflux transporter outer membrane subunit [Altericroceibacterium endophyticum]
MSRYLTFALFLPLAACAPAPGHLATPTSPDALEATRTLAAAEGDQEAAWPGDGWWQAYGDAQLDRLIAEARAASPDMAMATARLRQANALAQQAGAALLPTISADGSAGFVKQSYNNGIPADFVPKGWNDNGALSVSGSFDPDLWGRNRAALAAATSEAQAAAVDAAQAEMMLSTEVAAAYADFARLSALRDIARREVEVREATLDLTQQRVANGLDNRGTLELARSRYAGAESDLAASVEAVKLTRNRIAALVGAGPDRGLDLEAPQVVALHPRGVPDNLALDLLGRRPDIVSARLRAEAATSRIRSARAAFYPNINITALFGVQALGLDNLFDSGSTRGSAGGAFSLPLFNRGRLTGDLRGAEAGSDLAVASYDKTLIDALHEVADAATSIHALDTRRAQADASLLSAEKAYDIAQQRYAGGLSNYLAVLTAEDSVLTRRRISAELRSRAFTLDVALIRALGGGFSETSSSFSSRADRAAQGTD